MTARRVTLCVFAGFLASGLPTKAQHIQFGARAQLSVKHDVSQPLRNTHPLVAQSEKRQIMLPHVWPHAAGIGQFDTALQTTTGPTVSASVGLNFEGLGDGEYGFQAISIPPDPNGSAGSTQFVEAVNLSFAVFDKATGALVYGPALGTTLWAGFGGPCENTDGGDPIVLYDKAAGRWVMTELGPWYQPQPPYYECIAVSTSSDATGSYNRYAFAFEQIPDFDKIAVWPDAYYMTFNRSQDDVCALDRSKMLAGQNASIQCFSSNQNGLPLIAADLDGSIPPPIGSPNYLLGIDPTNVSLLNMWKFHVDFTQPSNSTLTGPIAIPVAPFVLGSTGEVAQLGTSVELLAQDGSLRHRLAYRNFGTFESLIVNHAVNNGSGIRWYELRNPGGNSPLVFQQGTFVPDSTSRWMGSIAMDKLGDIALGYSVSSSAMHPGIRFTGRVPSDPLGTLEGEATIVDGTGSQTNYRWGDYSSMSIDPVDDCTFWYTNEYLQQDGQNWHTRIASFRFPSCGTAVGATSPTNLTFAPQLVGSTSPSKRVVLTNDGSFQMDAPSVIVRGDFALQTNSCTGGVKPGTHCDVTIVFKPKVPGTRTGTLTFADNATNSPQIVSLRGTGTQVKLSTTSILFNTLVVGTTSGARIVSFANRGTTTVTINGISVSGDFHLRAASINPCPTSGVVLGSTSCNVGVAFAPSAKGTRKGTLTISDSDPASPQTVALTGTGTVVSLSALSLVFPAQPVNTSSGSRKVTLKNEGATALNFTAITVVGTNAGNFTQTNTCGTSVAAGASCTISVIFKPTATGTRTAAVSISDNGGGSPQKINLAGTGT